MSTSTQDKSLEGKVVLVTGGTSGLGLRIYRALAQRGAKVYVTGRKEDVGRKVASEFPDQATFVKIDLATMKGAKDGAEEVLRLAGEDGRLDIVVNNAALLAKKFELSSDGIVDTLNTTFFGHFILIQTLLPLLKRTASIPGSDVRIVTVGSDTYKYIKSRRFDTLDHFNDNQGGDGFAAQMKRYGVSKLAELLWMRELAARFTAEGVKITCISCNPGAIYSEGARDRISSTLPGPIAKLADSILYLTAAAPEKAATSTIWGATAPEVAEKFHDAYVVRKGSKVVREKWVGLMTDETLRKELWATAEKIVAEKLGATAPHPPPAEPPAAEPAETAST
ncbi:NAD(P)-binding protein [Exidia glandulosa HHB12029]|uniref:NAD(P)-binding protein n=1 Tax=Exidia glandulosa HHB12029 TaxID=1314781 RepID=A0A165ISR4_EXIGL|nr:NAD(P)-binding protein [Exidia glandulosa HHB12029]